MPHKGKACLRKSLRKAALFRMASWSSWTHLSWNHHTKDFSITWASKFSFYVNQFESCFCICNQHSWPITCSVSPDLFMCLPTQISSLYDEGTILIWLIFYLSHIFLWDLVLSISLSPTDFFQIVLAHNWYWMNKYYLIISKGISEGIRTCK